jgi:hypothetical protein
MVRRTKRLKGGKRIGQGANGAVFSPALSCVDDFLNGSKNKSKYVSKVMNKDDAEREYNKSQLVRELDPLGKWSITAEKICPVGLTQDNANFTYKSDDYQILYKNGGVSLWRLILKSGSVEYVLNYLNGQTFDGDSDEKVFLNLNTEGLPVLIKAVKKLLPGLNILNKVYLHSDLHFDNIVYDGTACRLIDFMRLEKLKESMESDLSEPGLSDRDKLVIEDEWRSLDVSVLFYTLLSVLKSKWVAQTFPGHFTSWLEQYGVPGRNRFRSDYLVAILTVPEV